MSKVINIGEAKAHFSRLVAQASQGEVIVIAKAGKPMARLVPLAKVPRSKKFGLLEGQFKVPENFDMPLDANLLALFR